MIAFLETVNRSDIGMIEGRQHASFALEASESIGVMAEDARQDLQRDVAPKSRVSRAVDVAHTARAKKRSHDVTAPSLAGQHFGTLGGERREHPRDPLLLE